MGYGTTNCIQGEESRSRGGRHPPIPRPPGCGGRGPDKRRCRGGASSRPPQGGLPRFASTSSACAMTKRSLLPLLLLCFSAAAQTLGTCETTPKAACEGKIADESTCTTAHVTPGACTFTEGTGGAANTCTTTPLTACEDTPAKQGKTCTDAGVCTFTPPTLFNPEPKVTAISTFNRASWDYVQNPTTAVDKWGSIEDWDTSRVVSMR